MRPAELRAYLNAPSGQVALWGGVLLGPLAWVVQLGAVYIALDELCDDAGRWLLSVASVVALALALAGLNLARNNRRLTAAAPDHPDDGTISRCRFVASCGLILSLFFSMVIIALWVPLFLLDPCAW
jgi:hypothetical protein